MREIKFRVFYKGTFTYFDLNLLNDESRAFYDNEIKDNQVMQYIGLKDKLGVEIYDGDIVNIQGGAFYQGYWEIDEIFEVIYSKTTFMLKNKDYKENFWIAENIYVIGNIYENKDLLL